MGFIKLFLFLVSFLFSQSSYALVDAQVLYGVRSMELSLGSKGNYQATELRVAAHLDPIPLIPIAFGLSYGMISSSNSERYSLVQDKDYTLKKTEGDELAIEVMVWSPIALFGITPYVKAGYTLYGSYEFKGNLNLSGDENNADFTYDTTCFATI